MKEGYWVIRTYFSGTVGEKTKFWIPGKRSETVRGRQRELSEIKKQEQNEHSAVKALARLLNANCRPGDLLVGLDYSEAGLKRLAETLSESEGALSAEERMDKLREAAEHEMVLFLRRVKRRLSKDGITLYNCGAVTSDMDGETGEAVRVHHHLVVNKEARDAVLAAWHLGGVSVKRLREQEDYTPLAEYLLRQVRRVKNEKKYVTSRNLVRPEPRDRVAVSDAELSLPRGAKLIYRAEFKRASPQYIRFSMPKRKRPPRMVKGNTATCARGGARARDRRNNR